VASVFSHFSQVRAGLTPKFKDVDNLVNMLTYSMGGPTIDAGAYSADNPDVIRYTPPCPEFEVMILTVEPGKQSIYKNPGVPVIMIILEGSGDLDGKLCRPGRSYYWPKNADDLQFTVDSSKRGAMKVALAHKNLHLDRPTAINREDFGGASSSSYLSVPSSPRMVSPRMPYMGMGGTTPIGTTPQGQERKIMKIGSVMESSEQELPIM
jgi:mannose-6-phosphate isomerase